MQETSTVIKIENLTEQIELITLNRPEVLNAISSKMAEELKSYFKSISSKKNLRTVIITGAGEKAFCAGADLKERTNKTNSELEAQRVLFLEFANLIENCDVPVIVCVNGIAYGGGCEIALLCDFIISSKNASFALPEAKRGLIPGLGGTQRLSRRIGIDKAKELIFTGRAISSDEAFSLGLVNHVVENNKLIDKALSIAKEITECAPISVKEAKKAVNKGYNLPIEKALDVESASYKTVSNTEDRKEGIKAFNEKRRPQWTGK